MSNPIRLFIFGLGYSATALALAMRGHAASLAGTVRTETRESALAAEGIAAVRFDGTVPTEAVRKALQGVTHVIVAIPPGAGGDPVLAHHRADLLAAPTLAWVGYMSSVGV